MRIFLLGAKGIPSWSVSGSGGVERHVEELASRLAAKGHQVFVYVRAHGTDPAVKTWKGVHLIRLPTVHRKTLATIMHVLFATWHVLFQRADVIHYHGVGPATLAWIPRLLKWRSRVVVTFHNRDQFDPKWRGFGKWYLAFGEWAAVRFPHETIVVSHVLQVFCRKLFHAETWYIPNGATIPTRKPGTDHLKRLGLVPGGYLLSLGRLVERKAYDVAIEAVRKLEAPMPYVIAGDAEFADPYVEKLQRLATKHEIIRLVGYQHGAALEQLLAHCYAFIHPARAEGLPVAILEAMAHGKVVVMSDIPENRQVVDHSGITFPVDNVRRLRETLDWLLADPAMVAARGHRAREVVHRLYSWDVIVEQTLLAYRSA